MSTLDEDARLVTIRGCYSAGDKPQANRISVVTVEILDLIGVPSSTVLLTRV